MEFRDSGVWGNPDAFFDYVVNIMDLASVINLATKNISH
jgi:hypothetical protein